MNMRQCVVAAAFAVASACSSAAPVAYEGVLSPSVPVTGQVGGFSWFLDMGAGVDYWQFPGVAGQTVSLTVDRLNGNLDPGLSFYSGTTSADTSQFSASGNWGGLTFIGSLDDERPPSMTPGLGGDPSGSFMLASSGNYTVVVGGSNSTDAGSYPYRLTLALAAPIPEAPVWAMVALGLAGLRCWRRRRG